MRIRTKGRIWPAVVAAAAVGMGLPAIATATDAREYTPGAPGVGDPYFPQMGNGGYNADHYDLDIGYTPNTGQLTGVATIEARATQNLSRFNLDFQDLDVTSVSVDGHTASHAHVGQELTVTPERGLPKGSRFTVKVSYAGVPKAIDDPALGVTGFVKTHDGAVTLSTPTGSATWYPVNDHPTDKATYNFRVTVPAGLTVLANGVPAGSEVGRKTSTFRWSATDPMASYLAMVAIGKFDVKRGRTPDGIENITATDPGLAQNCTVSQRTAPTSHRERHRSTDPVNDLHASTASITDWEAKAFGSYPFSSTGGIVDDANVGYALETQTRPVYDCELPNPSTELIVHELAHQWYGDSVSPRQWKDVWLNEGLATYAEWLYAERHGGPTAQQQFQTTYDSYPETDSRWQVIVDDPGRDDLFAWAVYDRGAMALQVLRNEIGDTDFLRLLRAWPTQHRNDNANTAAFIALAERISGKDLDVLFKVWLSTPGKPSLE